MDTNKMREQVSKEFKAWFAGYERSREVNGWMPLEPFVVAHMHNAFIASRESVVVELPSPSDHEIYNDKSDFLHIDGESLMSSVRYAIEAQGLKVAQ
jgi:hypothetical protein